MRVLVTGGAGYVGSVLTPLLLESGHAVRVLDGLRFGGRPLLGSWGHPGFELVCGDIRDAGVVREALRDVEAVVHLAAIVGDPACAREPDVARAVNLDASRALHAAARAAGVRRFLFASTCSNYGRMAEGEEWVDEGSPLRPLSLYAETKVGVERMLLDAGPGPGPAATIFRCATVYGVSPRMRFDLTVNEFTRDMVRDGRLVVYGEQFWRPYVHVRDLARAMVTVLGRPEAEMRGAVFNVGADEENYRKADLIELIRVHVPGAVVERVTQADDPRDYRVRFGRIRDALGFRPVHRVADGIAEVVRLVRSGIADEAAVPAERN